MSKLNDEELFKLFRISHSILPFVRHDILSGFSITITYLRILQRTIENNKHLGNESNWSDVDILIEKGIKTSLKHHQRMRDLDSLDKALNESREFKNDSFLLAPSKIIDLVQIRYEDVDVRSSSDNSDSVQIFFPPFIFLAILYELMENAKKAKVSGLITLIKYTVADNRFKCEVHDNGPRFPNTTHENFINKYMVFEGSEAEKSKRGSGLDIINNAIGEADGLLLFSISKILNGALIYFEFPLIGCV